MDATKLSTRWLFAPVVGVVTAGALAISGGFTSAQSPTPDATETPGAGETTTPTAEQLPNYDEILAEKLEVSVEELRDARSEAQDDYIDELVEAGVLTDQEAEDLKAWNPGETLRELISEGNLVQIRDFLLTEVAGLFDMEREALEEDLSEGMSLKEIAEEQDISNDEIQTRLQDHVDEVLDMATQNGLLSEEQATDINDFVDRMVNAFFGEDEMTDGMTQDGTDSTPEAGETPAETPTNTTP